MYNFILLLFDFMHNIFRLLSQPVFNIGGVDVTLTEIFLGFMALSMLITVFWKGSRA